ncbi:UNC-like C-terminal-domain-containing protein [Xylariomycetidae sp. FL0641]|nr:UNC-like C-terminal-domain-containing protein [Xylariomycetidae sp. FL0641]
MWPSVETRHRINTTLASLPFLLALATLAWADSTTTTTTAAQDATRPPTGTISAEPTCASRTVNYITHTLPQQCLTSSPSPPTDPVSVTATESPSISTGATPQASASGGDEHAEEELDPDGNDLSTGAFMSFEEWKAMMLEKTSQEAPDARARRNRENRGDPYNGQDLDTLGDDGEINLDFGAYSDKISEIAASGKPSSQEARSEEQVEKVPYNDEGMVRFRSKDAGKTCKERFSYSSFDGGATVLKASPGAKNPTAILVENKDSYMLLECGMQNKFFIVELSDDILVDTIVLANFEFFSSMVRHFRVSISDRYPVKLDKWKVLGTFEARNARDIQAFLVENPQDWAKYIRIEILSHYGNEYYCPVSLLRVHGTRMLDSWKEADPLDAEPEEETTKTVVEGIEETAEPVDDAPEETMVAEPVLEESNATAPATCSWTPIWHETYIKEMYPEHPTCDAFERPDGAEFHDEDQGQATHTKSQSVGTADPTASTAIGDSSNTTATESAGEIAESQKVASSTPPEESPVGSSTSNAASTSTSATAPTSASINTSTESSTNNVTSPVPKTQATYHTPKHRGAAPTSMRPPTRTGAKSPPTGSPATPRNKTTTTTTAPAASPTVQDSFFKALTKRLQMLESNTTLSMQYIESQSKFLQEALARLEKRQVGKVDLFLDTLNKTVLGELREVKTQYDQIWQSTVIALETQQEQSEREIVALSSRLGVLADEVVFQKRMAIVQSVLLLGCLILVIFSRGLAVNAPLDAYYPSQFGAAGRLMSPLLPSTPKGHHHHLKHAAPAYRDNPALLSVHDPRAAAPNRNIDLSASPPSVGDMNTGRLSPSRTPESRILAASPDDAELSNSRRRPHGQRPPSPSRSATDPSGLADYFEQHYHHPGHQPPQQPPTPDEEAGYDSEPAGNGDTAAPIGSDGGYFSAVASADHTPTTTDAGSAGVASFPDMLQARQLERQLTPSSSSSDGGGSSETTHGLETTYGRRPGSVQRSASARKPLPALPEDSDL